MSESTRAERDRLLYHNPDGIYRSTIGMPDEDGNLHCVGCYYCEPASPLPGEQQRTARVDLAERLEGWAAWEGFRDGHIDFRRKVADDLREAASALRSASPEARCPTCNSPDPKLCYRVNNPRGAVPGHEWGGEITLCCPDPFHAPAPSNEGEEGTRVDLDPAIDKVGNLVAAHGNRSHIEAMDVLINAALSGEGEKG